MRVEKLFRLSELLSSQKCKIHLLGETGEEPLSVIQGSCKSYFKDPNEAGGWGGGGRCVRGGGGRCGAAGREKNPTASNKDVPAKLGTNVHKCSYISKKTVL